MRYLLDTHTFLWTAGRSKSLPKKARRAIEDADNLVFVSAVSFWEIATKFRRGRLDLDGLQPVDFVDKAAAMEIEVIHLEPEEAATVNNLIEDTHFDPFDRMLIWQAISRKMILISGDAEFKRFKKDGLKLLWS
jgi:PIN domain nuclease of toxin-antitoxin system